MSLTVVKQNQTPLAAFWVIHGLMVTEVCYGHAYRWPSLGLWQIVERET
jgi:hypothetical protein